MSIAWGVGALCAFAAASAGNYYKWTDAQGTMHYSQTQPPGQSSQMIFVSDGQPLPPPPELSAQGQQPRGKGRLERAAELRKVDARASAANCATAKVNIERLQHSRTVVSSGNADTARTLDSDQRRQALEMARRQQARYCVKQ